MACQSVSRPDGIRPDAHSRRNHAIPESPNKPVGSKLLWPALTTVRHNPAKIGRMAAELLLRRIADPGVVPDLLTLEPKLVIRESCGGRR